MPLRKITDATVEPVTVAEAKWQLKEHLVNATNDAYIGRLITSARQAAEERMERTLLQTTWLLTRDAFPSALKLERPRILAVDWVKYIDDYGQLQELSPDDYQLDKESEPGYVVPGYGLDWPVTRHQINAVQVQYTAGYGTEAAAVPASIKDWILAAINEMYDARGLTVDSRRIPNTFMHSLLDGYVVWGV